MMNYIKHLVSLPALKAIVLSFAAMFSFYSNAQNITINSDWQYLESNVKSVSEALKHSEWQTVVIPHTWNATDTVDSMPGYRRDASWYRKTLTLPKNTNNRFVVYFEGVNMQAEVFVNGEKAFEHIGGYVGFDVEITRFLSKTGDNEILVRASNEYNRDLIPSQKSDFFIHGGITRDVWLKTLPQNFISRVQVDMPKVSTETADTLIISEIDAEHNQTVKLTYSLTDPSGTEVLSQNQQVDLRLGKQQVSQALNQINKPQLWSPAAPNLYNLAITLTADDKELQTINQVVGYRWFEMKPNKGFYVNGEKMLIRGTHRHEEHAGIGAALSNKLHYKDMQQIKDMGANFVRLGHYPQDPEVYKAANELGLVIWDELPWCRGGIGGDEWKSNTEYLLKAQIKQNRNEPSIAFWSLGNEMYWEEDFEGGGDPAKITPYLEKLNQLTKQLDPSRITTIRKYYPGADIVDAFSPSIWAGWYGGSYGQYADAIKSSMQKYPTFLHMEYGASSHVGRHTETPISKDGMQGAQVSVDEAMNQAVVKSVAKDSDWNENYAVDLFDWHTIVTENTDNFAGNAQWAFKDFGTPLRPENPIPYMNQKGLVDRNGNPKDAYYVFASHWSTKPFCYIESKTWTHRNGPKEGQKVTVYCNTETAELSLNNKSLGKKKRDAEQFPAGGLVWQVPFENGENTLRVHGRTANGVEVKDTLNVNYLIGSHGEIAQIKLSSKPLSNGNVLIEAQAVDTKGNRVLDYNKRSYFFNMTSHGQLIENQGTPTGSSIIEMTSGYAAIEFIPGQKPTTIEYRNQNVKGVYLAL
ncbi:glycoside hydrolase family 2 TIM barrel-domain containing protein [Shewanella sp. UCD-KL21]|uniref:glycoside hydrolase family 2 protein n=1 Tax=Shewanella sp. UCD-KL21 TaxID=1917164 RepID=UPI0020C97F41|nr:glycoside hydrolase family 2 TIM barrel-domain containing protein [Shewanella sp. UCD-KL21]